MNEQVYFTPPTVESVERSLEIGAYIAGMPVEEFSQLNGFEFLDVIFESDKVKQFLFIPIISSWVAGSPTARGSGPVEMMAAACGGFGNIKGTNHMLVHAFLRVYKEYGGTLWKNTKVEQIVVEDGKAVGIRLADDAVMHPGKVIRAKHAVISNTGARPTLSLLGDDVMKKADGPLYSKMKHWDMATRPSSVTVWVLKEPPKWLAGKVDDYINGSDWTFKGYSSMDEWKAWVINQGAGDIDKAFGGWWEFFIGSHIDPTQAGPEGHVTMRIEEVLPYHLRGEDGKVDPLRWEQEKWKLVKQREDMIEEWAPGFKDSIVDVVASSPVDLWRSNMTAINGCSQGGPVVEEQQALTRMPYRMPIKNLYMSNSVYPASLSWGASGYNAACVVAEDMGIRNQSWWVNRPGVWFQDNLPRLIARTEKLKEESNAER